MGRYYGGNRPSGLNVSVERIFARFPVVFPLVLIAAGAVCLVPSIFALTSHGRVTGAPMVVGIVFLGLGVIVLPFGIMKAAKRRLNPIVLTCPKCNFESRALAQPFKVQKWDDVDYSSVTCSVCGKDFTVPRNARLL